VILVFASVGALVFFVSSLVSGDWDTVWERKGTAGALFWAYEHAPLAVFVVLFALGLLCAWMPFNRVLAAVSLGLFYPALAIMQLAAGRHSGNFLPLEFFGYLFTIGVCLLGYVAGRAATPFCARSGE
jgi:hypothetical protein